MRGYNVEVVADSISPDGMRLVSLLCRYPRIIHAEVLRHRVFSHSVASSRAIPPERLIEQVENGPFVPEFPRRVVGMGYGEPLRGHELSSARNAWTKAMAASLDAARRMVELNVAKCHINRLLEPYIYVTDLITGTEWSNFLALRDHPDAQPEMRVLARMIKEALNTSEPFRLEYGEWHMPLLASDELPEAMAESTAIGSWEAWKMTSAGRCARVSYDKQHESEPRERSYERAQMLVESGHLSPLEHVARPATKADSISYDREYAHMPDEFFGNYRGWMQMRKEIPNEDDFSKILATRKVAR